MADTSIGARNDTSNAVDIQGLPVSISCTPDEIAASTTATTTPQTLTLLFGYEFAVIDPREPIGGEVIYQDLPTLEYFLLHYVADAIGLLECNAAKQRAIFQEQEDDLNTNKDEIPTVLSLSNVQPDEWESKIVCSELVDLPPGLICLPLRGIMQATYVGSPEDTTRVEQMLSKTIESVLNGDKIVTPGIVDTIFIGSRVIPNPPTDGSEWRVSPAIWGTSLSLVAVLGIMGVFLLERRRKRRNQRSEVIPDLPIKSKVVMTMDPENIELSDSMVPRDSEHQPKYPDPEVPSVDPLLISIATTRTASETIVDTDDSFQDGSTTTTARSTPTPTHQHQSSPTSANNAPPLVINLQPRPKDSNGAALIRPPPNSKPPLPTKPPGPPSTSSSPRSSSASAAAAAALSKPLKQRRKKKRKKKPKMVRVSSRERANEMETIAETPEEGDNGDGDNDSEYSWYSETDSNASSRDVSPSRGSPVPSTSSSEDQIMVQLRQSLESPSQQLLLSCGSSSKDDEDDDDDSEGETEIVKLVVASSSSSSKASAAEESTSSKVSSASSSSSSSASSKPDQSRGSSPVPSYWT